MPPFKRAVHDHSVAPAAQGELGSRGYDFRPLALPTLLREQVEARDWNGLDRSVRALTDPGGIVFESLAQFADFSEIEFIISIRSSDSYADEDGIWHDDGSRVLAFSLSLTLLPEAIEGGRLEIRRQDFGADPDQARPDTESIATPPFGTMIVFATGRAGFEHRIRRVSRGERIIIAGWCT